MKAAPPRWRRDTQGTKPEQKKHLGLHIEGRLPLNDFGPSKHTTGILFASFVFYNILLRGLMHFARLRTLPVAGLCRLWGGRMEDWLVFFRPGAHQNELCGVRAQPLQLKLFVGGPWLFVRPWPHVVAQGCHVTQLE